MVKIGFAASIFLGNQALAQDIKIEVVYDTYLLSQITSDTPDQPRSPRRLDMAALVRIENISEVPITVPTQNIVFEKIPGKEEPKVLLTLSTPENPWKKGRVKYPPSRFAAVQLAPGEATIIRCELSLTVTEPVPTLFEFTISKKAAAEFGFWSGTVTTRATKRHD